MYNFFRLLSTQFRPKKALDLSSGLGLTSHSSSFLEQNCIGNDREASYLMGSRGVSLLIAIIILGSALLIVGTGSLLIGLGSREGGYASARGGEAFSLADGCMEEAYIRIRRDGAWGLSGVVLFTAPNGSCSIQVIDLGGNLRQIDVTAQSAEYTKHIRSRYSIATTPPSIASWEERSD